MECHEAEKMNFKYEKQIGQKLYKGLKEGGIVLVSLSHNKKLEKEAKPREPK